jgi:hypothetical protein
VTDRWKAAICKDVFRCLHEIGVAPELGCLGFDIHARQEGLVNIDRPLGKL